jgi:hypothetical protein
MEPEPDPESEADKKAPKIKFATKYCANEARIHVAQKN